jgi:flagellar protein FlaG
MSLDINSVSMAYSNAETRADQATHQVRQPVRDSSGVEPQKTSLEDIHETLAQMERVYAAFNRKLQYTINEALNEVVVKVVDANSDKVIEEIPPKELQNLQVRIRETLGILFDEKI